MPDKATSHPARGAYTQQLPNVVKTNTKGGWKVSQSGLTFIPEGWLINPGKTCLLRFHKDPNSPMSLPKVYMDKWSVTPCVSPLRFINRRKVLLHPALETWGELILNGWEKLEKQFGEAA